MMLDNCVSYFKDNIAYKRFFIELRRKWKKYGKSAGYISLKDVTKEEREALRAIMGIQYCEEDIKLKVSEFEQALHETNFKSVSLQDLLEAYFSESMETNKRLHLEEAEKKKIFFETLYQETKTNPDFEGVATWIDAIRTDKKYGYNLIVVEYKKSEKSIQEIILNVCKAVTFLKTLNNKKIRLAVLSAKITSNPHYFDKENVAGKLLLLALGFVNHMLESKNAENILELYYSSGIKPDDISSYTTLYGISLFTEQGIHKAYEIFIEEKESYVVTLSNLNQIVRADCRSKQVFIFENQMVFSHMCESLKEIPVSMICTSGQMKTASLFLIDLLCASGCMLYYSGDIDPEGIGIADRIISRHPENIVPWRLTIDDYRQSISNEVLDEKRIKKLDKIRDFRLVEVAEALCQERRAGYQELIIEQMLEDVSMNQMLDKRCSNEGDTP